MWRKKYVDAAIPEKIVQRVSKLPTPDLVAWADQALYTTGRYVTAHVRDHSPEALDEAVTGSQVLLAIAEEMRRRQRRA